MANGTKETVSTKDEVSLVLYDKNGNIKKVIRSGNRQKTFSEKILRFIEKVIELW